MTTIAWRTAHLIVGFAETHPAWIGGVRKLGQAGLESPQGATQPPEFADTPMARLVLYTNLEVIHHGAEICLLRDLYRARGSLGS